MLRLIFLLLFPFTVSAQLKRFQFTENKMGSPFNIIFYHTDSAEAYRWRKNVFQLLIRLIIFSVITHSESEVGKLACKQTYN